MGRVIRESFGHEVERGNSKKEGKLRVVHVPSIGECRVLHIVAQAKDTAQDRTRIVRKVVYLDVMSSSNGNWVRY